MSRRDTFLHICQLSGESVQAISPNDGWPGGARVSLGDASTDIAMHVAPVGSHSRAAYELRFQNPGNRQPVSAPNGALPILVGLYTSTDNRHILVATQGVSRLERVARFSILFRDTLVNEALERGWAVYVNNAGDQIFAFTPSLLPTYVELLQQGTEITEPVEEATSNEIASTIQAAGLLDDASEATQDRARRAVSQVIRHHAFGGLVAQAYGRKCALCGLGAGMTQGAHIYPASAPGSPDRVWNGISLCCNHHAVFDAHRIWIHPDTLAVSIHPELQALANQDAAMRGFLNTTYPELVIPEDAQARPRAEMFARRYAHFAGRYDWVD